MSNKAKQQTLNMARKDPPRAEEKEDVKAALKFSALSQSPELGDGPVQTFGLLLVLCFCSKLGALLGIHLLHLRDHS